MLVQQKIQAGFAVALAFLLLTGATAWWSVHEDAEAFRWVEHTERVLDALQDTQTAVLVTQTEMHGFLISGDETMLPAYASGIAAIQKSFAEAKRLTQDNPRQQRRLAAFALLLQKKTSFENEAIRLRRSGDIAGAAQFAAAEPGRQTRHEIRKLLDEGEAEENQIRQQHADAAQTAFQATTALVGFGSLLALGLVVSNGFIETDPARPLLLSVFRDVTERKQAEHQALRSQRLESIGTLAGGIAHDLNNALAPILMSGELLRMMYPGESQLLDMIESSAKRAAGMVRQLLTFAKGAEGERAVLHPGQLVEEMKQLMEGSFPKNLELVVKCDPELPAVLGNATQLHQVLLNLCVNARDAMPCGGTLTLEAQRVAVDAVFASSVPDAKAGQYAVFRVRDTGTGIPPEILDRIFDPFFTTKGPDKGTGLGLSTVMGIVKGHGGFLQVYSQPGKGSTFAAYLPADQTGGDTEHLAKMAVEFRGQGETILFVDDEFALRDVARAVLRHLNFQPLTATDGADGLIQAAQHRAELRAIITDLHMPHMDGLAFVRALRRMLPDIPVAVATGWMEDALAGELKTLGVTCRLDKPFTEAQLAAALKNLLAPKSPPANNG